MTENAGEEKIFAKAYIEKNWDLLKHQDFKKVKKEIKDLCICPEKKEMELLRFWFNNQKKSLRNSALQDSQLANQNSSLSKIDQAQQIYVQQIDNILQNILILEYDQKMEYLKKQVIQDSPLVMDFMKNLQNSPTADFIEIMILICDELQSSPDIQTKIFVRICSLHKHEILKVSETLIRNAIIELSTVQTDQNSAFGLLKLAYQNNIPFVNFPLESLVIFQQRYNLVFQRFFSYLSIQVDYQVKNCLPSTCFLFTKPFYKNLKAGGHKLYQNISPQNLTFFINMLAYSFENNEERFDQCLKIFRKGCFQIYGQNIDINPLLNMITEEEILRNPKFFSTLANTCKLLTHLYDMINEKILLTLDDETIQELLKVDEQKYRQRSLKPRNIHTSKEFEASMQKYLTVFTRKNETYAQLFNDFKFIEDPIIKNLQKLFDIPMLNNVQTMALHAIKSMFQNQKLFLQFETGIGKSTLALIFMLYIKQAFNINSLSIYQQEELCLRDFLKIQALGMKIGIKVLCVTQTEHIELIPGSDITLITDQIFQELSRYETVLEAVSRFLFMMDEFDAQIFDQEMNMARLSLYTKSKYFIGLTGSSLEEIHCRILAKIFSSAYMKFPVSQNIDAPQNISLGIEAHTTRKNQLQSIQKKCAIQDKMTPIILILDQVAFQMFTKISSRTLRLKDFTHQTASEIEAFLQTSFLNQVQGQEYDQFKGRTARMNNKGQHFVILWNKSLQEGKQILEEKLTAQQQEELGLLNNFLISLDTQNKLQKRSQVKKQLQETNRNIISQDINDLANLQKNFVNEQKNHQISQNSLTIKNKAIKKNENSLQDEGNPEHKGDSKDLKQIIFQEKQTEKSDIEMNFLSNIDLMPSIIQQGGQEIKEDQNLTCDKEISNIQQMIKEPNKQHKKPSNYKTLKNSETQINQKQELLQPNQFQDTDIDKASDSLVHLQSNKITIQDPGPDYSQENVGTQESPLQKVNKIASEKEKKEHACPQILQERTVVTREVQDGAPIQQSELNNIECVKIDLLKHPSIMTDEHAHNILKRSAQLNHTTPSIFEQNQNKRQIKLQDKYKKTHSYIDRKNANKMKILSKQSDTQMLDNTKKRQKTSRKIGKPNLDNKKVP